MVLALTLAGSLIALPGCGGDESDDGADTAPASAAGEEGEGVPPLPREVAGFRLRGASALTEDDVNFPPGAVGAVSARYQTPGRGPRVTWTIAAFPSREAAETARRAEVDRELSANARVVGEGDVRRGRGEAVGRVPRLRRAADQAVVWTNERLELFAAGRGAFAFYDGSPF